MPICGLAVSFILVIHSRALQSPTGGAERVDLRIELAAYLNDLAPLSAKGTRMCEFSSEGTPEEALEWVARNYNGAGVDWRRDHRASYVLDLSPTGDPVTASLFDGVSTSVYTYDVDAITRGSRYSWQFDLYPDAYFLDVPPASFRPFIETSSLTVPTGDELALGATDVLIATNPGLENDQKLRVAVERMPFRIVQLAWSYRRADGTEEFVERYRFTEFTTVRGLQFPLVHRKDILNSSSVDTTRLLRLEGLGREEPPADLEEWRRIQERNAPKGESGKPLDIDLRQELDTYLNDLCPLSASGVRSVPYTAEGTSQQTLQWLTRHYDGATVDWRRDRSACFMLDSSPSGEPVTASRFERGVTTLYSYDKRAATTESHYSWQADLYPEAYFLCFPPVPFRLFLASAEPAIPTSQEAALEATHVLVLANPGLENDQELRVALSREPLRILQIDWSYRRADGNDVLAERYRFSDWTTVRGLQFPLLHCKDSMAGEEVDTTRCLTLSKLENNPPPAEMMVPSGILYSPLGGSGPALVGSMSAEELAAGLARLREWVDAHPPAALFSHDDVELGEAISALKESSLPTPEVPLASEDFSYECGPNCLSLAMALQLGSRADYGGIPRIAESAHGVGTTVLQLEEVARSAGLNAAAVRVSVEELLSYGAPAILPVRIHPTDAGPSHFVLLAGVSDGKPILMNPPSPAFVANPDWLHANWDGDALVLSRVPVLARQRRWVLPVVLAGFAVLVSAYIHLWKRRVATAS